MYISPSSTKVFSQLEHYIELLLRCKINIGKTLFENAPGMFDLSDLLFFFFLSGCNISHCFLYFVVAILGASLSVLD